MKNHAYTWSLELPPNREISYDHVFLDTPIGKMVIEWKGWKEDPSYSLMLNDVWVNDFSDLEEAKKSAIRHLEVTYLQLQQFLGKIMTKKYYHSARHGGLLLNGPISGVGIERWALNTIDGKPYTMMIDTSREGWEEFVEEYKSKWGDVDLVHEGPGGELVVNARIIRK